MATEKEYWLRTKEEVEFEIKYSLDRIEYHKKRIKYWEEELEKVNGILKGLDWLAKKREK